MKFLLFLCFLMLSFALYSQGDRSGEDFAILTYPYTPTIPPNQEEQLHCDPDDCHSLNLVPNHDSKVWDQVYDLMGKNAGKILIEVDDQTATLDSFENEQLREYLREIAKREGNVVFEPYYINVRGESIPGPPLVKDFLTVGYSLYKRLRSYFLFDRTGSYHAKILYHPITHKILLYYFVHKKYGDPCDTVYSHCSQLEYLDDDSFDFQLSSTLKKALTENKEVVIHFRKTEASLPEFAIDLETIQSVNRSSRLYKWFLATKVVKKQNVKKERFLTAQLAITLIDYTLTAYDLIQQYKMYSVAREWEAVANYRDTESGKIIESVSFRPINETK